MAEISIIIPVYKVEKYLKRCLDSVLAQTFQNFEAICVDDGSPDQCGKILKRYARKDNRIKVVCKKNQGVSVARNSSLEKATGRYITFVDSDDELAPTFLENLYQIIKREKADIVSCGVYQGKDAPVWKKELATLTQFTNPFEKYMQRKLHTYATVWGKIYTKEVLLDLTFNKSISQAGEYLLYLYQALYRSKKFVCTSQKLYFYRNRPNSVVTSKLSERFVLGNIKTAELMHDYFSDKKMSSLTRRKLNQKIAKRIFKFSVLEPRRKDKKNLQKWYGQTRPLLISLKEQGVFQSKFLNFKNRFKLWIFLVSKD